MSKIQDVLKLLHNMSQRSEDGDLSKGFEADADDAVKDFFADDSETEFKIGDQIQKATFEHGDIQQMGHRGKIIGAMYDEDTKKEYYLVDFEGFPEVCLTLKYKITRIHGS